MRATIVADDNMVLVDGVGCHVDCSALVAENKHAVQWRDTVGEVEFRTTFDPVTKIMSRQPNEIIEDFTPYQSYIDAWQIEYDNRPPPPPLPPPLEQMQARQQEAQQRFKDEIVEEVLKRLRELNLK
jgi:hypothetical protein